MARMAALGLIILGVATGFSPLSRLEHLRSCASSHSRCAARMTRISAGSTQDQTAQDKARSKSAPDPAVAITAVGEATAVLPVVSTLIFVFAMESIFQSNFDIAANPADIAVLILLSMAAALSLYTTTFSVLECELRHSRFCSRTLGTNSLALLFVFSLLYQASHSRRSVHRRSQ